MEWWGNRFPLLVGNPLICLNINSKGYPHRNSKHREENASLSTLAHAPPNSNIKANWRIITSNARKWRLSMVNYLLWLWNTITKTSRSTRRWVWMLLLTCFLTKSETIFCKKWESRTCRFLHNTFKRAARIAKTIATAWVDLPQGKLAWIKCLLNWCPATIFHLSEWISLRCSLKCQFRSLFRDPQVLLRCHPLNNYSNQPKCPLNSSITQKWIR